MITSLPSLLSVSVYVWLNACNNMHINKMNNGHLDLTPVLLVTDIANAANENANSANQEMKNIAHAAIIPCLKKGDARADITKDQAKENLAKIQAKRDKIFPNALSHAYKPFGIIVNVGIIDKIWAHTAKIVVYALAMHIALHQPHCVVRDHMIQLVTTILKNDIVIHNKDELDDFVKNKLQHPTLTIDHPSDNNIMNTLQSILKSAHATIDKIDAGYFEIDDVFVQPNKIDNLESLYDQVATAFTEANTTDQAFQNAWNPILQLTDHCPLAALQQPLDATIKAKYAAKSAWNAYFYLAKYFDQFTPAIQTMLNGCTAWFTPTIQKKISSCDECVNVTASTADDHTPHLGVDLKAVQEVVDKFNEGIMKSYKDVQEDLKRLNKAIFKSYATAKLYNKCYNQYKNIVHAISPFMDPYPHQTSKTA